MKGASFFLALFAAFVAVASGVSGAQELAIENNQVAVNLSRPKAPTGASGVLPLERVLEGLRQARGFAFIFDSRLVEGKEIRAIEPATSAETELRKELTAVSLRLHKIGPTTFAITKDAPAITAARPSVVEAIVNTPIDTILVHGSATLASATAGSKRIFSIDADQLAYLDVTSPAEAIYDLPQSLASFTPANTALSDATAGISLSDLRRLGLKRTIVLVNGRRRTVTTGGNGATGGVDLNSIAEPFLERIEIQSLPGGARYGATAVAGAINFVTKSNIDGVEAGGRFGISELGDNKEVSLYALAGHTFETIGNLTVGVNLTRTDGLDGADRAFSAVPYGFARNGLRSNYTNGATFLPGFGGSSLNETGTISGVTLADGSVAPFPSQALFQPSPDGSIAPSVGSLDQLYNWAEHQRIILPIDRALGMLAFNREFGPSLRLFIEAHIGASAIDNKLSPLPAVFTRGTDSFVGDAAVIPIDNPTLPQSVRDLVAANFGAAAEGVVFNHRYAELGPRRDAVDRRYVDLSAGIVREEGDRASLSFTYRYSNNRVVARSRDRIDRNRLQIALDPAACAATLGCSPVDYFSAPEISAAALEYLKIPVIRRTTSIQEHEVIATFTEPLNFGASSDGKFGGGVELRRTTLTDMDATPAGTAPIGYFSGANEKNSLETLDAFITLDAPILRFGRFPGEIDASLAIRGVVSSSYDYANNFEAGLDWRPTNGVSLFMRRQFGERTPDIIELFGRGGGREFAFADPCDTTAPYASPIVEQNCLSSGALGAGAGFQQKAPLAQSSFFGNPDLEPEKVDSAAYGLTIEPTKLLPALPGRMLVSATWIDTEINQTIGGYVDIINACYSSADLSSPACRDNPRTGAPLIQRDPAPRQIISYDDFLANQGRFNWQGLDLELRYAVEPDSLRQIDSLWVSALHTYTDKVESLRDGALFKLDGLIDYPRHRTLLSAGIDAGRWSIVGYASRRGQVMTRRIDVPEAHVPPAFYLDTTIRFDLTNHAFVQASVQNLTDQEPAITAFNKVGNFAPNFYDPVGRRYALSVRFSF